MVVPGPPWSSTGVSGRPGPSLDGPGRTTCSSWASTRPKSALRRTAAQQSGTQASDIATHHPDYDKKPTKGGHLDREVLRDFLDRPAEMARAAELLRECLTHGTLETVLADDAEDETSAPEGKVLHRRHRTRERNKGLRRKKMAAAETRPCPRHDHQGVQATHAAREVTPAVVSSHSRSPAAAGIGAHPRIPAPGTPRPPARRPPSARARSGSRYPVSRAAVASLRDTARRVLGAYAGHAWCCAQRFRRGIGCLRHHFSTRHARRSGEQHRDAKRTKEAQDALSGAFCHNDPLWLGMRVTPDMPV